MERNPARRRRHCGPCECPPRAVFVATSADFGRWLDPKYQLVEALTPVLVPDPAEVMEAVAVSPLVNSPKNDGPECLAPAV